MGAADTARALSGALLAGCLLSGCRTTPWVRGGFEEGLPRLERRFPRDVAFHVDKTEKRVRQAFSDALKARGFTVVETDKEADVILKTTVDAWEFNDAGFAGFGKRDDMELSVLLVERRHKRILSRARISIRSDFRILSKYVETF